MIDDFSPRGFFWTTSTAQAPDPRFRGNIPDRTMTREHYKQHRHMIRAILRAHRQMMTTRFLYEEYPSPFRGAMSIDIPMGGLLKGTP